MIKSSFQTGLKPDASAKTKVNTKPWFQIKVNLNKGFKPDVHNASR